MTFGLAFEERPRGVSAAAPVKTQQHVIVPSKIGMRRGCHQRRSVAEAFKMRPLPDRGRGVPFDERSVWRSTRPHRIAEAITR
jgi:hypothetical protein